MASAAISKRPDRDGRPGGWLVRWREVDGKQRKKSFPRKVDAERFRDELAGKIVRGEYIPPEAGRVSLESWAAKWLDAQGHLKESTRTRYEGLLRKHVVPRWGSVALSDIRPADVQAWLSDLTGQGLAPGTVRQTHRVLALLLKLAVRDGRLSRNPAEDAKLPKARRAEPRFLTGQQVADLAEHGGPMFLFLSYSGLRFGEAAALRVEDVDLMRRRVRVHRSSTEVGGRLVESDTTKTHAARTVPLPRFVAEALVPVMAGRGPDDYAFPAPNGGPLRIGNWRRRVFDPACAAAGIEGVTPHDLRHSAASLAISAGASVKAVQRMLGHASASMTLDVYAGLFDADLEAVADRLDAAAPQVRPRADVVRLAQ